MKIHQVIQGTDAWHALRSQHFNASEAPVMMGASKVMKRTELLHAKKIGDDNDVHWWVQKFLYDKGHEAEALARPIVQEMIGEELFPVVGTAGNLLASMDGATVLGDTLFEHKLWNEDLAAQVHARELDPHYYWQLEQQLLVSGAELVIFVCSDGTEANFVHMEYRPVPGRREQLLAGWKQFDADLEAYVPANDAPAAVGCAPETLPTISYKLNGLEVESNLKAFRKAAEKLVEESKKKLETDEDFANRDSMNKAFKSAEERIVLVCDQVISELGGIETFRRELGDIGALLRQARLNGEKQVEARKTELRNEIVMDAAKALQTHIDTINSTFDGLIRMPKIAADFPAAIKGKRTIASLRDAASTELARAKIEANKVADNIRINRQSLNELAANHKFLFSDAQQLVLKDNDDLIALIKVRIADHEAAEKDKAEALAEEARELIRQEEIKRLADEQAAKDKAEHQKLEQEQAEAARVEAEKAPAPATEPAGRNAAARTVHSGLDQARALETRLGHYGPGPVAAVAPTAPAAQQTFHDGKRIKLGDISSRLGFNLTADFLRSLGFEPVDRERAAMLYRAADFPRICGALVAHIHHVQQTTSKELAAAY